MIDEKMPALVWIREPCPQCGAATASEAEAKCSPIVHCPGAAETDADGFLVTITRESAEAYETWHEKHGN